VSIYGAAPELTNDAWPGFVRFQTNRAKGPFVGQHNLTTTGGDDRRVRKTRRLLHDALITLILERGWDAVSVRDVCEKADVGRSTFYVHFADKENLLLSGFDELHLAMEQIRATAKVPFGFLGPLAAHAAENARLVQALFGRQSGQSVQWRFRDVLASLVEAELKLLKVPKAARPLMTRFIAGGAAEVLMSWLDHPQGVSAEKLALELSKLAIAAVEAG
jgi:AcrR family transcriptional regulator